MNRAEALGATFSIPLAGPRYELDLGGTCEMEKQETVTHTFHEICEKGKIVFFAKVLKTNMRLVEPGGV